MFGHRYFSAKYFGPRYFGKALSAAATVQGKGWILSPADERALRKSELRARKLREKREREHKETERELIRTIAAAYRAAIGLMPDQQASIEGIISDLAATQEEFDRLVLLAELEENRQVKLLIDSMMQQKQNHDLMLKREEDDIEILLLAA